ncbi:GrpB family protein, partial [Methylobacterium crusticola]|uniref:GrpB family protein n=1 Tax=Methylobacterium crusticola TaxID=1697972 RepID=UPI001EE1D235
VVAATGIAAKRVEHIGSTAIPGLGAKPIIDLMVGVARVEDAQGHIEALEGVGYEWRGETVPGTLYLRKA